MNNIEYIDRLIDDLKKTAKGRAEIPNLYEQVRALRLSSDANLKNFFPALSVLDVDLHLNALSQLVNSEDKLVEHEYGNNVDISIWIRDISANKIHIQNLLLNYCNNPNLIDMKTEEKLSIVFINLLDLIHKSIVIPILKSNN